MTPNIKNAVLIGGFALLGIVAAAGWARKPEIAPAALQAPAPAYATNAPAYGQTTATQPIPGQQAYGQQPYGQPAAYPNYAGNCIDGVPIASNVAYTPVEYRTIRTRPRVVRHYTEPVYERRYVRERRGRSTGKSVAIVAGSAGVGAAIGALAGGGKGAGIGALSGGAAGFIYDRLTHNR